MNYTFTRDQIKAIIIEELALAESADEKEALELISKLPVNEGAEEDADRFEKLQQAKRTATRIGTTILTAAALLFGGINMLEPEQQERVKAEIEQLDDETLEQFGVDTGKVEQHFDNGKLLTFGDIADMPNTEKVNTLWNQIDRLADSNVMPFQRAKVASPVPMVAVDYNDIPDDLIMPNSLTTKENYKAKVVKTVLKGKASNLRDLERFVFGNTGKWISGSGEDLVRYRDGKQVLPPEWSVAYDLYGDLVETLVSQAASVLRDPDTTAEQKKQLYNNLGVSNDKEANAALNTLLYRAGRQ